MEKDVSTHRKPRLTPEEYLEIERKAEMKSEYIDGEMFAMSGVSFEHNTIVTNLIVEMGNQFEGRPCHVNALDLRVKVSATGMYAYPDVIAFCGKPELEDKHLDTLLNPQVIIEVLSESTEAYDRGKKFAHYKTIGTLREYILISQTEYRVEKFSRRDNGAWDYTDYTDPRSSVELTSVACRLVLSRVYRNVEFEPTAS